MTVQIFIILLLIGLSAGVLSGLVGIGGGIIMVPALVYFLHYTQHQAQGTSLGVLALPVVLVAFLKYYSDMKKEGNPIEWEVILLLAGGFVLGGYLGSSLALKIDKDLLRKIFAVLLIYTAIKMLNVDRAIIGWFK